MLIPLASCGGSLKYFRFWYFVWPLIIASGPAGLSYKVLSYEMDGRIVDAEYFCMSKAICSTDYKVRLSHGNGLNTSPVIIDMRTGKGERNWPLRLEVGDSIKKEKWSNVFCINGKCNEKSIVGNLLFSFILYVIVGWLIRVDVARQREGWNEK